MSATTKTYLTCAETAKQVRAALKAEFGGTKFVVRSKVYAGGASIDVGWTDGPTSRQVDAVLNRFCGASFDGMIDLKSHHSSLVAEQDGTVHEVQYGADYVHGQRTMSDALLQRAALVIEETYGFAARDAWSHRETRPVPAEWHGFRGWWTVADAVRSAAWEIDAR